MISLRPCRTLHSPAFGRFDEIFYLVEKTSDLTLPDSVRSDILSQSKFAFAIFSTPGTL
jgi:hypothetical protein